MQANNSAGFSRFVPGSIILRAVILEPLAMAVWWFLLKGASLWLLRYVAYVPLALLIAPAGHPPVKVDAATGAWVFNVSVNAVGKNLNTGQQQHIESTEFSAGEDRVAFFASGWFSYLALALSTLPFSRRQAYRVSKGFALQTALSVLCLAAYAYINGYGPVINTTSDRGASVWLLEYVYHLIYLVIPFAGPFLVALLVHPEWREYLLRSTGEAPPPPAKTVRSKHRR